MPAAITLTAAASDSDWGIARVEFYKGAVLLGSDDTAPYACTWTNMTTDMYALTAKAIDLGGATATTNAAVVTVNANSLPTVSLTAPANNTVSTPPASFTLTADAADSDWGIARVEFYQDTTLLGSDDTAPYACTWADVPTGRYILTAKAIDLGGATATSAAITVTVNTPPTLQITEPADGTRIPISTSRPVKGDGRGQRRHHRLGEVLPERLVIRHRYQRAV